MKQTKKRWSLLRAMEKLGEVSEMILCSTLAVAVVIILVGLLMVALVFSSLQAINAIVNP